MIKGRCSIIIPSRDELYLSKTVDDVFAKARGDIEVIVVLDGDQLDPFLADRDGLRIIRHVLPLGTRCSINEAARVANGEFLFKLDAHCCLSEGFDEVLKLDHNDDWVVTLSRYSLNPDSWRMGFGPVSYEYIAYPLDRKGVVGGLTPKKWIGEHGNSKEMGGSSYYWMEKQRSHLLIDEIQTCNAACWFVSKNRFEYLGGLNEQYWSFHIDGVEMGFKAWLSGGQLMINKKAHHGHWWKSEKKRTVPLDWAAMRNTQTHSTWYWTHNQWPKQTRTFAWFVKRFWPIPGWPETWEEDLEKILPLILLTTKP